MIKFAASGKSGGFLARNWGNRDTTELHHKSFDLHKKLAAELGLESFRMIQTLSVNGNTAGSNVASWLDRRVASETMDSECAQVTPKELTDALIRDATVKGAHVLISNVLGVRCEQGAVVGVETELHGLIETEKVVVCLGPWSGVFCEDNFGMAFPMQGIKSTSLVYEDVAALRSEPFACFCEEDSNGCHLELYSRVGEELYVCGCGGSD